MKERDITPVPSDIERDLSERVAKARLAAGGAVPESPDAMLKLLRDAARSTEQVVKHSSFEKIVRYWFAHAQLSPFELYDAATRLVAAYMVLRFFANNGVESIDKLRFMRRAFERRWKRELEAFDRLERAERDLRAVRDLLGLDILDLHVAGNGSRSKPLLRHPDPAIHTSIEAEYRESWRRRVDDAATITGFYRALTVGKEHRQTTFMSWAIRYVWRNTSIRDEHIVDRKIFPRPWVLLTDLLDACGVATTTSDVRTIVKRTLNSPS